VIRKILLVLFALIVVVIAAAAVFVGARQNLKFDMPYPDVAASSDSAVIARGRYIVRNVANCSNCHGDTSQSAAEASGAEVPLSGGFAWNIPPGQFHALNITPDDETGLGRISDRAIARALRRGVGNDGRALLPFMEMQGLSDDDLTAVVSYLRSQPPIHNPVPAHSYTLLGKVVKATLLANPVGPKDTPPAVSPRGATLENGRYLAESVALCWACHTQRDEATGSLTGPRYGGATGFLEPSDPGHSWSPPNITSDPETGRLGRLNEDEFVARFRAGRAVPNSPMPWQGYARMNEDDVRAIYRFLKSIPAVKRDVGPPVVEVAKKS
jgi:mono/diheme cytochrome c family protein